MAEVTNELIYEVLKQVQDRLSKVDLKVDELKNEVQAVRGHLISLQQDVHNIYGVMGRHDVRFEHIENRLGIHDVPAL